MVNRPLSNRHVRLYTSVRTAHLERAHELPPAAIIYRGKRYDFDDGLTAGLELVQTSAGGAAMLLARSPVTVLEVNEPLMVSSLRMSALAIAAVRLRGLLIGQRAAIVTYAIGNLDPWSVAAVIGPRARLRRWSERLLARFVWRQLDRICYGTAAAQDLYAEAMGTSRAAQTFIPALPVALAREPGTQNDPMLVVYLGIFLQRKGIDEVMAAWPLVRQALPDARLQVLGKGALEAEVRAVAASDESIDVVVDPPRSQIRDVLSRAQVLALPSQPTPSWREQVGLPIVEALAAGCSVVTTTETGLASWLAAHGHSVIPPKARPQVLAEAIVEQLRARRPAEHVLADLPIVDGRLEADGWMFASAEQAEQTGSGPRSSIDA